MAVAPDADAALEYMPPVVALLEAMRVSQAPRGGDREHLLARYMEANVINELEERAESAGALYDTLVHPAGHVRHEYDTEPAQRAWAGLLRAHWPQAPRPLAGGHQKNLDDIVGAAAEVLLHDHLSRTCPLAVPRLMHVAMVDIQDCEPYLKVLMEKVRPLGAKDLQDDATVVTTLRGVHGALRGVHSAGVRHRDLHLGNVGEHPDGRIVLYDFGMSCGRLSTSPSTYIATDSFQPCGLPEETDGGRDWAFFCAHILLCAGDILGAYTRAYLEYMACVVSRHDGARKPLLSLLLSVGILPTLHALVQWNRFPHAEDHVVAGNLARLGECPSCGAPMALCVGGAGCATPVV